MLWELPQERGRRFSPCIFPALWYLWTFILTLGDSCTGGYIQITAFNDPVGKTNENRLKSKP